MADELEFDLSRLAAGKTGRQNDPGVGGPGAFRFERIVPLIVVTEKATGKSYYLDPVDLALGRFEAHRWLVCDLNLTASPTDTESLSEGVVKSALFGLDAALADLAKEIPGIVLSLVKRLLGL